MQFNPGFQSLHPYPFEKLNKLKDGLIPPSSMSPILLSIGEPKHTTPAFILDALCRNSGGFASYPTIAGMIELREAICQWLQKRFRLPKQPDPETNVLPVNGTREALFAFAQCLIDPSEKSIVVMPNPFYQIYEGAALLAGAEPFYIKATEDTAFLPDFASVPESIWKCCKLVYFCSPGNPTGTVAPLETLKDLISLALKYDFVIASDECYSEIYFDESHPPPGLLQAAAAMGNADYKNCLVFHSLSKRSNVPGMRSGFVAGSPELIAKFRLYRTYHGCSMPPPIQIASTAAWTDEEHVLENREQYRRKFDQVLDVLHDVMPLYKPDGAFYLWPQTPVSDTEFARELYRRFNVTVLPGSYLSRSVDGKNPGADRIRIALVAPEAECLEAAHRIRTCVEILQSEKTVTSAKS
ncbi:MAG TPA: succinyldiaminopimelate transaminase [Oculatellaceae cyanobacterium]